MSAIELFLAIAFGLPICVALCCLFFAITYYQVKPPKEDKDLKFNTLSNHEIQVSTNNLLKQDKKRRRRAQHVTRQ